MFFASSENHSEKWKTEIVFIHKFCTSWVSTGINVEITTSQFPLYKKTDSRGEIFVRHSLSWKRQRDYLVIYYKEKYSFFHIETIMMTDCSLNLGVNTIKKEKLSIALP